MDRRLAPGRGRRRRARQVTNGDARSRARLGAFAQHAAYDTRETTRAAREAFARRFEREVDPDGVLPAPERARRADAAKRAYFQRMALRSAKARRRKV